jgi:hypothetical protein
MTTVAVLNQAAQVALADCEQRIERGLKTFIDVGQALAEIRDSRLYRGTHETFEVYLEQRWQMSRSYAHRMIAAAEVVLPIGNIGLPTPSTESQARELAKVPEPERADVWREAVERTNGKPTAAAVRETYERTQTPGPSDAAVSPPGDPGTTDAPPSPPPSLEGDAGSAEPERATPPPGSPATWGPAEIEANRLEVQRRQIIDAARRHARTIVTTIRSEIVTVVGGVDLGERGLITEQMVADIREAVDLLASRLEVKA